MKTWQNLKEIERRTILGVTSEKTGISEDAIEKDWWVSMILNALFQSSCANYLLFKGGTSLSKGWNLINRFSEDIDLAIDRSFWGITNTNKNQRDKLQKLSLRYVRNDLKEELQLLLTQMGMVDFSVELPEIRSSDEDPSVLFIPYKSIADNKHDYIPPMVRIEISCRSLKEPSLMLKMRSMIADVYPNEDFSERNFPVNTVSPSRTFLEKAFLLHEEFQKDKIRTSRMSRHLYDLERLMNTAFADEALSNSHLYIDIVNHRYIFNRIRNIDYHLHHPSKICFVPPESVRDDYKRDYENMQQSFIYGQSLSFNDLMIRISELQNRFRKMQFEGEFSIQ